VGGMIWPQAAAKFGWKVVMNASFPVNATQFGSLVQQAKSAKPDLLLVDAVTPQGVAIRKQMAAANFTPKYMNNEKGAEPVQYAQALGKLSDGVLVGAYWDPSLPYPGAKTLKQRFERETGQTFSQHLADSMTAAQVLMDAIARAGTTDPAALNKAIAATDRTYVAGPIKFGPDHTSPLKVIEVQWQHGATKVVGPTRQVATGKLIQLGGG
jgi:branched-chain amino acid transport system substrate-binding protein